MPEAVLAGHPTHWRVFDRGGPRPVLALHCSLAHGGAWSALAAGLSGLTVTAPDLPGHGQSGNWDGGIELQGLASRIAAEFAAGMDAGRPVDLLGHSFGATVCLRLALERPELVRSLTLAEPVLFAAARAAGSPAWNGFRETHRTFADLARRGQRDEAAAAFHAIWGGKTPFDALPDRQRRYILDRIQIVAAQDPALIDDVGGLLRQGGLEAIAVPVLLLEGGDSPPVIAAIQGELARRLPRARRLSVPGAGHMLPLTHAADLAPVVQAHLAAC